MKTAHQLNTGIYERLGIDLKNVGCLMLDTTRPCLDINPEHAYVSEDPKKFWVNGVADNWHVTARYGFLEGVNRTDVDAVLEDVEIPESLYIHSYEIFPSPYKDEPYDCLVARVEDEKLNRINTALSILPNVNTFVEYKAHITIGYFKQGKVPVPELVGKVKVLGLNYGHNL